MRVWIARDFAALSLLTVIVAACSPPGDEPRAGGWVGDSETSGNVTTVVNESGSVWGGTAQLIEEASIGVDLGEDPYMLGRPAGVYATDDRIYLVDEEAFVVRVYDHQGVHLFSFGQRGQGPGEFQDPYSIGGSADGRIFVGDYNNGRINVYTADGGYLADYPLGRVQCCVRQMVVTPDGLPYWHIRGEYDEADPVGLSHPMQAFGEDGPVGDPVGPPAVEVPRTTITVEGRRSPTPFSPELVWRLAPSGAVVWGTSDAYRFEVRHPGGQRLVVERNGERTPVGADEREWARLHRIASRRRSDPAWNWNGAEIPDFKPAFDEFVPAHSGEIWVVRPGPGVKDPECDDGHTPDDWPYHSRHYRCWRDRLLIDVFDAEGVYLGDVEAPEGIVVNSIAPPFIRGDMVVGALYSPDGVIRVKRYRLVPPRGDGQ